MVLRQVNRYASNKVGGSLLVNGVYSHPKMIDTLPNLVLKGEVRTSQDCCFGHLQIFLLILFVDFLVA